MILRIDAAAIKVCGQGQPLNAGNMIANLDRTEKAFIPRTFALRIGSDAIHAAQIHFLAGIKVTAGNLRRSSYQHIPLRRKFVYHRGIRRQLAEAAVTPRYGIAFQRTAIACNAIAEGGFRLFLEAI